MAAVVQATLHFLSWLQPSILNVCPNNSSSRTSVLISGPRNLKCSSWFCATTVFIILILNEKSSCGLVFAQFLEEGEGCAGMRPFLLLEADLVIPGYWTGSRGPGVLQKMSGNGGGRVWSESKPDSDTPQPPPVLRCGERTWGFCWFPSDWPQELSHLSRRGELHVPHRTPHVPSGRTFCWTDTGQDLPPVQR